MARHGPHDPPIAPTQAVGHDSTKRRAMGVVGALIGARGGWWLLAAFYDIVGWEQSLDFVAVGLVAALVGAGVGYRLGHAAARQVPATSKQAVWLALLLAAVFGIAAILMLRF